VAARALLWTISTSGVIVARFARIVAVLTALYMAIALVWDGSRDPFMGIDYTLYGASARPVELVGAPWPAQAMKNWAERFDVDVVVNGSPRAPGQVAGYAAHADSEFGRWLTEGYPCLRKPCVAKPVSLTDKPESIASFEIGVSGLSFMGSNSLEAAQAAQRYFSAEGWQTGIQELNSPTVWISQFRSLFPQVMLIVAILIFMLAGGATLDRSRSVGVQLLQGIPRWQIALSEQIVWTFWLWVGAALALAALYLGDLVVADGHFYVYMLRAFVVLVATFWLTGLVGSIIAHVVLRATSMLDAIKGRLRFGASFPIMYFLRSVVIVFCGGLLLSLSQTWSDLQSNTNLLASLGQWREFSTFGVNTGAADNRAVQESTAAQLTPLYADGRLVITRAKPEFYYTTGPDLTVHPGEAGMVAEVNSAYLEMTPTKLANGRLLSPARDVAKSRMTLLFPESTSAKVKQDIRSYVAHSMFGTGGLGGVPGWDLKNVPLTEVSIADGGVHFSVAGSPSRIINPVLIVFPNDFVLGKEFAYTSEGILVRTGDIPRTLEQAPSLGQGNGGFDTVESTLAQKVALLKGGLERSLFELGAYLILLPLSTIAVVLMYMRQHRRRIFVQSINGRRPAEMAPLIILLDVVTLCATAWFARPELATVDQLREFGENASLAPMAKFGLVMTVFASLIAAEALLFRRTQRRLLVEHGSES